MEDTVEGCFVTGSGGYLEAVAFVFGRWAGSGVCEFGLKPEGWGGAHGYWK